MAEFFATPRSCCARDDSSAGRGASVEEANSPSSGDLAFGNFSPSARISAQDVAIIYRRAQIELTALRQDHDRSSLDIERQLSALIESQLAEAAEIPRVDTDHLTDSEKSFARLMGRDVLAGRPLLRWKGSDSRLTEETLRSLLAELKLRHASSSGKATAADPAVERKNLLDFAVSRARELSGINDNLRPDELLEIENIVDMSMIPEAFKFPTSPDTHVPAKPPISPGSITPELRQRIFFFLGEICTKVFPLIGGLDANSRRLNLVKFIKDNPIALGVAEALAEEIVEQFIAENPGAVQPNMPPTTILVPTVTVSQPAITTVPNVVLPVPTRRSCLSRWWTSP
jgi:hypothetical protein